MVLRRPDLPSRVAVAERAKTPVEAMWARKVRFLGDKPRWDKLNDLAAVRFIGW